MLPGGVRVDTSLTSSVNHPHGGGRVLPEDGGWVGVSLDRSIPPAGVEVDRCLTRLVNPPLGGPSDRHSARRCLVSIGDH